MESFSVTKLIMAQLVYVPAAIPNILYTSLG